MNILTKSSLKKFPEYDNHKSIVYLNNPKTGLKGFIAFHKNSKSTPSFGATRYLKYKSEKEALRDALRLSRLMSYKSAMAGLKYGGAKAVIMRNDKFSKEEILKSYSQYLNRLSGKFITGTDVGLDLNEIKKMKNNCKYLVGIKSNPEKYTAIGIFVSIKVISKKIFKTSNLKGRTYAIQGVGKVGYEFLKLIYKNASNIYISDTNNKRLKFVHEIFPKTIIVKPSEIHKQQVDIYMPCALSYGLNKKSVNELNCKIIAGSANNQLESIAVADRIQNRNIFYAPDYVINAGGLISVVDEYKHNNFSAKRIKDGVSKIKYTIEKITNESFKKNISPARIANEIAEKIIHKM
ncbi:MAG: hypothetical protein KGI58_02085 [Patescibacteria group bacterium]|nr:hypothetical protein [Patescibacteria group bacterium]